jgi:cytochrome P450
MRKKYGRVFRYIALNRAYVVCCEPDMIRRILTDTKIFPKGQLYSEGLSYCFGQSLVTSDGERHKADRARFSKYFVKTNIVKFAPIMNSEARRIYESHIDPLCTTDTYASVDLEGIFAPLTLRVFSQFCVSKDLFPGNPDRELKFCKLISDGSYYMAAVLMLGLPTKVPIFPWTRVVDQALSELEALTMPVVEERRKLLQDPDSEVPDDCLTQIVRDNIPKKDMLEHLVTLLCAGHDTTAFFTSYCLYLLAEHVEVQDKLRDEIYKVVGDREEVTPDDIALMPYMKCVMQETLRLFAIIPNVSRHCQEDYEFKEFGITIPKDTIIIIPMCVVNRDPELWDNPSDYIPERFEGTEMTCAKKGFFPFGYGSRVCIGNSLAQLESSIFLSILLRKYELKSDPSYKLHIMSGISLTTTEHIRVQFKKRS